MAVLSILTVQPYIDFTVEEALYVQAEAKSELFGIFDNISLANLLLFPHLHALASELWYFWILVRSTSHTHVRLTPTFLLTALPLSHQHNFKATLSDRLLPDRL